MEQVLLSQLSKCQPVLCPIGLALALFSPTLLWTHFQVTQIDPFVPMLQNK